MQKVTFSTDNGVIVLSDTDEGSINGSWRRLWLNDFDGNSLSLNADTLECLDVPGQKTLGTTPRARTITLKIGFAPLYRENGALICTGELGKHTLRREVLKLFPIGAAGTLTYKNNAGEWSISAWVSETPKVSYAAPLWAEATVYLIADYPYWELSPSQSDYIIVPAGETGTVISSPRGDMSSPFEVYVTVLEAVPENGHETLICGICDGGSTIGWRRFSVISALSEGLYLKYSIGINGEKMCYKRSNGYWIPAPEYIYYTGYELELKNGTSPTTFGVQLRGNEGKIKAYFVFHNLVSSV